MEVKEPDMTYDRYSYADYLGWNIPEIVEIIKGRVFKMNAAPKRIHQKISGRLFLKFGNFLEGKKCEVYDAPFDVRLSNNYDENHTIFTVVQPDLCVICDPSKLDEAGCLGAPDLIVEILSPGNSKKELQNKYEVYEESGVLEYWVISPEAETLLVYSLINGKYQASKLYTSGDQISTPILPGLSINLEELFLGINE
ncbi:MAG: Uma2 family endonuclease [Bacteroidia bacterium]|nr:Uma2 family endonuclease [Bacteroidia bacterium]MCF8425530.1 Uma2 family endonuclease [Bacteroidia bacterium]MCF8445843.1 Uma2 family endonuclease [Bacteroidia bacterium]